jgi:carboxyl-terminal processing protease
VRTASAVAAAAALFLVGLWLGGHPNDLPEPLQDVFVDETASLSGEAADLIEDNYYREVPRGALNDGSVEGMIEALRRRNREDRFSHYFDPEQAQLLEEETEGRFSGVGLSVVEVKRGLRVVDTFEGSPAQRAQIKTDDVIVSVNGRSIAGESSQLSTAKIKGPEGTEVMLGVLRPSSGKTRMLKIERQEIQTPVVESSLRRAGGERIAYVHLLGFSVGADGPLREAVQELQGRGATAILLDLRGNPGGLLDQAVATASVFLDQGQVVVRTDSRTEGKRVYEASGDPLPGLPMVVLIDRGTASAAEILASALADHGIAEVVGTRSFGKGLFQHVLDLPNGGELDLSVGKFFTADGASLAPDGIHPGVEAKDDPATKPDEALRRALEVLARETDGAESPQG